MNLLDKVENYITGNRFLGRYKNPRIIGKLGENPTRSRHCKRGVSAQNATDPIWIGKAVTDDDPKVRRPACFDNTDRPTADREVLETGLHISRCFLFCFSLAFLTFDSIVRSAFLRWAKTIRQGNNERTSTNRSGGNHERAVHLSMVWLCRRNRHFG